MGLVTKITEIICSARKDIVGDLAISGQPYSIEWKGANITERERKALRNLAWCAGMSKYQEDNHLPEIIEVKWSRSDQERPSISYPLPADYSLELQHV